MWFASLLFGGLLSTFALASQFSSFKQEGDLVGATVSLDYGTFAGLRNGSSNIISFQGIRYADPPTGKLRWKAPVSPPTTQLGTVKATKYAKACIATKQTGVSSGYSEDCLFGNVYIPADTRVGDQLPVMVWFHGGGYQGGSTHDAPPDLILKSSTKPLIFVSFEYRLGQFGFLGGSQIKGDGSLNAGLLDQRAALRWVKRYIHYFGGDASKVTIWGQSAGSGSVMYHLIANNGNNEDLFRAAIGDSPPLTFTPSYNDTYDELIFQQFAGFAGCSDKGAKTLQCLRSASSSTLARAGSQLLDSRPTTLYLFAPVLDGDFIRTRPVEAFTIPLSNGSRAFSKVPILVGSNTNEGANWSARISDGSANTSMANATEATVYNFLHGQYSTLLRSAFDIAVNTGSESGPVLYPFGVYESYSLQAQQMYGEMRYICTAAMIAGAMKEAGIQQVYQYHYDNPHLGSDHKSELDAFFSPPDDADGDDLALFQAMREYWTSFVTAGWPTSEKSAVWLPVNATTGNPRILLRPGETKMKPKDDALSTRCAYWYGLSGQIKT